MAKDVRVEEKGSGQVQQIGAAANDVEAERLEDNVDEEEEEKLMLVDSKRPAAPPEQPVLPRIEEPMLCGVPMKWLSLVSLTFQTTGQALLIKWSDAQGRKEYLPSTVVFWTEVVKLVTSIILVVYDAGDSSKALYSIVEHFVKSPKELSKAAVPSLIYTVQNNLMFYSLTKLSAPVQQVLYQMKIITTAGLGVLMLGKSLGPVKWSACFLLAFGIMVVQVSRQAQMNTTDMLNFDIWQSLEGDQMKGFVAVLVACMTSGFAGVWIQKMLQQTSASIWMRNIQLGLFGSCTSLLVAVAQDGDAIINQGFHTGYNIRVLLVIGMNAFGGLLCAVMLKYAGATHGCFSTALSIILTCVMSSILLHDFTPDMLFVIGTGISVGASFLFALGLPSSCSGS
mmetsp:Transcript_40884/g.94944  ORF Transcript_40884/g.94944 Transcript_40884/m.94944 type:complete len:396 (+) Transcript_40884:32-1219(+)